ncbi:GET complex subunit GET2 ASCRUDRAFT_82221 [Ascoidea rubescens DSM 1968]|uniref:Golgi to ER traffic protein 2 n=1 Tax=Ascoidea rubescens DSM 1968 TaxID=1344418 RepID=A0A1D2VCD8_9ASCO|nr:hypothetical protein ASCRUDRAFT_82221 [Ascoidea rubescens DSM 1968]ODV59222.1 hypothetical protein ASCRUDRAFT_82221 [Ascoidea rubescens DSM 1968]
MSTLSEAEKRKLLRERRAAKLKNQGSSRLQKITNSNSSFQPTATKPVANSHLQEAQIKDNANNIANSNANASNTKSDNDTSNITNENENEKRSNLKSSSLANSAINEDKIDELSIDQSSSFKSFSDNSNAFNRRTKMSRISMMLNEPPNLEEYDDHEHDHEHDLDPQDQDIDTLNFNGSSIDVTDLEIDKLSKIFVDSINKSQFSNGNDQDGTFNPSMNDFVKEMFGNDEFEGILSNFNRQNFNQGNTNNNNNFPPGHGQEVLKYNKYLTHQFKAKFTLFKFIILLIAVIYSFSQHETYSSLDKIARIEDYPKTTFYYFFLIFEFFSSLFFYLLYNFHFFKFDYIFDSIIAQYCEMIGFIVNDLAFVVVIFGLLSYFN